MLRDDLLGAGQPDARTADAPRDVGAAPVALKDVRQVGGWNAHPFVTDRDHCPPAVRTLLSPHRHGDPATLRAVLDRVGQEVVEHSPEPRWIRRDDKLLLSRVDADPMVPRRGLSVGDRGPSELRQVTGYGMQF